MTSPESQQARMQAIIGAIPQDSARDHFVADHAVGVLESYTDVQALTAQDYFPAYLQYLQRCIAIEKAPYSVIRGLGETKSDIIDVVARDAIQKGVPENMFYPNKEGDDPEFDSMLVVEDLGEMLVSKRIEDDMQNYHRRTGGLMYPTSYDDEAPSSHLGPLASDSDDDW